MRSAYLEREWVYYFDDTRGRIKIGYSLWPDKRLAEFRTVNPDIEFLIAESGNRSLEWTRHNQFDEERIGGEWFIKSERLEEWIAFMEAAARIENSNSINVAIPATYKPKFDKKSYQRELMRERRAATKMNLPVPVLADSQGSSGLQPDIRDEARESLQDITDSVTKSDSSGGQTFDKKVYQREYMRKKRADANPPSKDSSRQR